MGHKMSRWLPRWLPVYYDITLSLDINARIATSWGRSMFWRPKNPFLSSDLT